MPFDADTRKRLDDAQTGSESQDNPKKIAVVGSGVSGLSAAWLLSQQHHVVVYEADDRLGGHANTVRASTSQGDVNVDAGFIVFNEPNYPNLTALFSHLGVETENSCMSFAVSMDEGRFEYSGRTLSSVFANRLNAVSPSFWRMLGDVKRFHQKAKSALAANDGADCSLRDFITQNGFSKSFVRYFLEPMAAAIWSTPSNDILDYPAASFFQFFDNHGLLQVLNMPVWRTVTGGSISYVDKISRDFRGHARLKTPVARIVRESSFVRVVDDKGESEAFDDVVIATHADDALRLIEGPTEAEQSILGAFPYQYNKAVMHTDRTLMPRRKRAWASWNYLGSEAENGAAVTYWMNQLQNLHQYDDIFVTLNPSVKLRDENTIAEFQYAHPMFNLETDRAQHQLWSLQGVGGVWYCGAHFGSGFHEDGIQSGLAVAEALAEVRRPWSVAGESSRIRLPSVAA